MKPLTFDELSAINRQRCGRWHAGGIEEWSVADWAVAMAGEAGEVCDAVKKLRRIETNAPSKSRRQPRNIAEAHAAIGEEIADTVLYADLLAQRLGFRLEDLVAAKFNKVSIREGFPERIGYRETGKRRYLKPAEKELVRKRQGGLCDECGKPLLGHAGGVQYDHKIPLCLGGSNDLSNFRAVGGTPCHADKSASENAAKSKADRQGGRRGSQRAKRAAGKTKKLPPRPFDKTKRRKFDGTVEVRR